MLKKYKIAIMISIVSIIIVFLIWENKAIAITEIDYENANIPQTFAGYKIVQISDLHNTKFGKNQEGLLKKIRNTTPDIIVITGDLIDRRKYDLETAMVFIKGAVEIAPVYYVSGNHEAWSGDYDNISSQLLNAGVQILDDHKISIIKEEETIELLGLSDPAFLTSGYMDGTNVSKFKEVLEKLGDETTFQVLLSHRPELFDLYAQAKIDLTFSGHAHGGQVRLPFVGGLVAPNQGIFPKYTSGSYVKDQSTLVVSRGLGNSIIPLRIFNNPEIVVLTLKK